MLRCPCSQHPHLREVNCGVAHFVRLATTRSKVKNPLSKGSGICCVVLAHNILTYAKYAAVISLQKVSAQSIYRRCQPIGCHLFSRFGEENSSSTLVFLCLPLGTVAMFRVSPQNKRLNLLPKRNARRRLREQIIYQS